MPHPKEGYYNAAGKEIPSVTTIIKRFAESGGLIYWAFRQGQQNPRARNPYEESMKAADVGTLAHQMVEASIKGLKDIQTKISTPELIEKARQAYGMYRVWANQSNVRIVETEVSLVSEEYQYGGTGDAIGEIGRELCLLEWKSSNAIYVDHLIQMAANGHLWHENFPDRPLTGGYHLLRFSKDEGDFAHFHYKDLSAAWRAFVLMRELYEIDRQLKKRLS